MPIDRKLLDILCCPATGVPLEPLRKDQLAALNTLIAAGKAHYFNDDVVTTPLQEALITENGERIYRIDDGIPIMLEERAIPGRILRTS
ncbi:MAG TPA: Trm112 family protein [Gammaproteobacteria bacterium]|nr:Trm112 family protein [Gammaproteobacteria bacterium]